MATFDATGITWEASGDNEITHGNGSFDLTRPTPCTNQSIPAGHVDAGEPARHALAREVAEEIGLRIGPGDLDCCLTMHRRCDGHERVDFFFTTQRWDGQPSNREPHKCDDLAWYPAENLPPNMVPYVRAAIERVGQGRSYAEFGWDPIVVP